VIANKITNKIKHNKPMFIMLIITGTLFGALFLYQFIMGLIIKRYMMQGPPPVSVATMKVKYLPWKSKLNATGTLRAIKGVDVTTEIAGIVKTIYFTPGSQVQKEEPLIELNDDIEIAQLHALEAQVELAKIVNKRNQEELKIQAVSQATFDASAADLKNKIAQAEAQAALVSKKKINAPFSGKLGFSAVNPGQYVNAGNKIVTLQSLEPIYVDFYVPQQWITKIALGQEVNLTSDAFPKKTFTGKITTLNPIVDINSRNIQIEATVENNELLLLPGMYAQVEVITGKDQLKLTVPQTAISYNPYGDIVYIVKETAGDKKEKQKLVVTQTFVTVGETRGEQITIEKGLKENDTVVVSGQLKLKNGSAVVINNAVLPSNQEKLNVADE